MAEGDGDGDAEEEGQVMLVELSAQSAQITNFPNVVAPTVCRLPDLKLLVKLNPTYLE